MIQTYSPTIRRREMEAVLTCMVDEKIGPGEMSQRLIQTIKEYSGCEGAVALRSPSLALQYALQALDLPKDAGVMVSALAPVWQLITLERLGYKCIVLDVAEDTGLIRFESVEKGIQNGGRLLILTSSLGILPEIQSFLAFNIPIIEDISQAAFCRYPAEVLPESASIPQEGQDSPKGKCAGMYGVYSILGMESTDVVTAGGGAVLIAPNRKEWYVLKKIVEESPSTDSLPDMNAALAFVEAKEFDRNEKSRKELYSVFSRAIMSGRHKTYVRAQDDGSTIYSFPVVLSSGFKDVKAYSSKKGIEVRLAYENSIIAYRQEALSSECICANSLLLRCVLFPLYPRLGQKDAERIVKVLTSIP